MSRQSERLFAAMNDIDDKSIDEAAEGLTKRKTPLRRWMGIAAALFLVAGAGFLFLLPWGGGGSGGSGSNDASTFMSYAGPVMPLTLREANDSISAQRDITLDFAPWVPVWVSNEEEAASREGLTEEERQAVLDDWNRWYPEGGRYEYTNDILVTDAYTLTNTSGQEQTVSVLYPFAASLQTLGSRVDGQKTEMAEERLPTMTLDGREVETVLHAGSYSGGFNGAWGSRREGLPELNLAQAESWEAYRAVLSDGTYQAGALGDFPDLSGIPVVVYEFFDPWEDPLGPRMDEGIRPSVSASFILESGKTSVLTTGFHGGSWDMETGEMTQGFTIPMENLAGNRDRYRLVVLGEDIRELTATVYGTTRQEDDEVIEGVEVPVQRTESDLETVLREIAGEDYRWLDWIGAADFELFFGLLKDELAAYYDILSDDPAARYADVWISESDLDFWHVDRVFYLEAEVTIPAGESVILTAEMLKAASFDFNCANTKNRDVYGYDMMTELGSKLLCTGQSAHLEDRGQIKIVRQNFGFDLKTGVKTVELDRLEEHYYLEVKRAASAKPTY